MSQEEVTDFDRILRPGHVLTAEDVLLLSRQLEPRWKVRARRYHERDALIRSVRGEFFPGDLREAARRMEEALRMYLAGPGRWEKDQPELPSASSPRHISLHRLARALGGKALGAEQLYNVFCGKRTPSQVKYSGR